MTKLVWTQSYRPFICGGDVNAPIGANMEVGPEVNLGKGFKGHVLRAPNGKMFIVESQTGGIVGNSLEEVQRDIERGDERGMKKQIKQELERLSKIVVVPAKELWKQLHGF